MDHYWLLSLNKITITIIIAVGLLSTFRQPTIWGFIIKSQCKLADDLEHSKAQANRLKDMVNDNHKTVAELKTEIEGFVSHKKILAANDAKNNIRNKFWDAQNEIWIYEYVKA